MENANSFGLLDCVTFRRNHDVISMGVCQLPEVVNPRSPSCEQVFEHSGLTCTMHSGSIDDGLPERKNELISNQSTLSFARIIFYIKDQHCMYMSITVFMLSTSTITEGSKGYH